MTSLTKNQKHHLEQVQIHGPLTVSPSDAAIFRTFQILVKKGLLEAVVNDSKYGYVTYRLPVNV
jgi:hypothetical protein